MDNIIIRWYNKNRKMIWIVILTVIGIIGLIQALNNYHKENSKGETSDNDSIAIYNKNNYSVITREEINDEVSKETNDLIKTFFEYCNNQNIEQAYNLLSADCKEEVYPTIEDFQTKYYDRIFDKKRSYDLSLWIVSEMGYTYRMEIMEDLLSSGNRDYMPIEQYYTITAENTLNISNFIGRKYINIPKTQNDIKINVRSKKVYIDYETYEIEVKNNTGNDIVFNTKEDINSIYIQDENGLKYMAFINEIPSSQLVIQNGITRTIEIKFNRGYKPTINIEKIVFDKINNNQKVEIEL